MIMPNAQFLVFKGEKSWTGKATSEQFPEIKMVRGETFDDILHSCEKEDSLGVLPIWNAHEGEIKKARTIRIAHEQEINFHKFWPYSIKFACLARKGFALRDIKKITSVDVAENQCSDFLKSLGGIEYAWKASTVDAEKLFDEDMTVDALLIGKDRFDMSKHDLLKEDVSNNLNFTTFALLGNAPESSWPSYGWDSLLANEPKKYSISTVAMPPVQSSLTEEQHEFLESICGDANSLDEIPKIIFVGEGQEENLIYLILEYSDPDESGLSGSVLLPGISVRSKGGRASVLYADTLRAYIDGAANGLQNLEFYVFHGSNSCLFACPNLKIYIQGYDQNIVEPVFRKIVSFHFEAYEGAGIRGSMEQNAFIENHLSAFRLSHLNFFDISPASEYLER